MTVNRFGAFCLLPLLALLAACSTTEPTTRQVETTRTTTVFTDDGPVTTTTHTVTEEDIPRIPEQDIAGFWQLRTGVGATCLIELRINGIEGGQDRQAVPTQQCDTATQNAVGWRLDDDAIELRNRAGRLIGRFVPGGSARSYTGYYELGGGGRAEATLTGI